MLGGPVYIALIRYVISLAGVIIIFSLMSQPRFGWKKTAVCYGCFGTCLILAACVWYYFDQESCARISAFAMYMSFCCFACFMSLDHFCLKLYKLALTFYLLAVFLIGGIEVSILLFNRNVWADIIVRFLLIYVIALFIEKKAKQTIRGFGNYMENELDRFSITIMIISVLFGIGFIINPNLDNMTPFRLFQIAVNFFLTGALQLLAFRLYLHLGKEKEYEKENQLMQMNHRLMERNIEILEESAESGRRIRHDVRHHNAVIAEYARRGQNEELLQYLKEYDRKADGEMAELICANTAVNNILSAYTRKARAEQIRVSMDVELGRNPGIPMVNILIKDIWEGSRG